MTKRKSIKGQQRSTKHTYKAKYRVTRTPLKAGVKALSQISISGKLFCKQMRVQQFH